eukprot:TRINITY_DN23219_c0_g1_i1.p1 TRINITY_DN23219_c0_g1~~TRINITY_DN23219_c0_g1_i1.p1  ORF type:complete len:101 (-),score=20.76 TRINITY_DN23219_c0_g1_i1:11-313(-)
MQTKVMEERLLLLEQAESDVTKQIDIWSAKKQLKLNEFATFQVEDMEAKEIKEEIQRVSVTLEKIKEEINALESSYSLSLIHICRCRRYAVCRSRWSPYQ